MYLKRLALRGFKTFVSPTEFEFDAGITAIVGPNGSGKSNLVDAVRWVLGEQSLRLLRSRRTEDVIFAGSSLRAPLGLAEVCLTLDNEGGWIPLPHAEVTLGRRAYRSGESEYLVNGQRLRLRDLTEHLARSQVVQNGYAIVGQGTVDAVLSWRAEERRSLVEEAAGLRLTQTRLVEARQKLAAAEADLVELEAHQAELRPKLEALQGRAELAQRRQQLANELREILRHYYGIRWARGQAELTQGRQREQALAAELVAAQQFVDESSRRGSDLEAARQALRAELAQLRQRHDELQRTGERWRRQVALAHQRTSAISQQQAELQRDLAALSERELTLAEQLAKDRSTLERLDRELAAVTAQTNQAQTGLGSVLERQHGAEAHLRQARSEESALAREALTQREARLRLEHQQATLRQAIASTQGAVAEAEARLAEAGRTVADLRARDEKLGQELTRWREHLPGLQSRLEAARSAEGAVAQRREALSQELHRLHARGELASPAAGSSAEVLRRAIEATSPAVKTLGEVVAGLQLEVPSEWALAVEAALLAYWDDLVVATWEEAEAVLALVRQTGAVQCWLLCPEGDQVAWERVLGRAEGVIGQASELAEVQGPQAGVVRWLLGRTLVVADLAAARALLPRCPAGAQLVTLAGEVLQPPGRTGAAPAGTTWFRAKGLRQHMASLASRLKATEQELATHRAEVRNLQQQLDEAGRKGQQLETDRRLSELQLANAQSLERRAEEELARRRQELEQRQKEATTLGSLVEQSQTGLEEVQRRHAEAEKRRQELEAEARSLGREWEATVASLRARHQFLSQERQARQELAEERQRALALVKREQMEKQARCCRLTEEGERNAADLHAARERVEAGSAELKGVASAIGEKEAHLREVEAHMSGLRADEGRRQQLLAELAARHREAEATVARLQQAQIALEQEIRAELGDLDGLADKGVLETLEERRRLLRTELLRIGPIEDNGLEEFTSLQQEHDRRAAQLEDIRQAAEGLRQLAARLENDLEQRFQAALKEVGTRFEGYFRSLFGGGRARLELTESSDGGRPGVEIAVQPPGRRLQSLAPLSGGERALASVALLFALLAVNPPPFCVLDEVDAALDEANAARFCQILNELSARTQFLLITHNRVTMENAGMLYGITLNEAGVSQVVSLRLPQDSALGGSR